MQFLHKIWVEFRSCGGIHFLTECQEIKNNSYFKLNERINIMSITNTFHSSGKGHAIGNASKLSGIQRHNERGYFSFEYSPKKIHNLIGKADSIVKDVKTYINTKFQPAIDEYNQKQRRKDRKIRKSPFVYFSDNKKLDIANEVILQIGDMDFWSATRIEDSIIRNGKEIILKDFPDEVKVIMDDIYLKQAIAYENIYVTHKEEILRRIKKDYDFSKSTIAELDEVDISIYESIIKMNGGLKKSNLELMPIEEKIKYDRYMSAKAVIDFVEEKRLLQRIEDGDMEIKLINLTSHYDEYSPHAHGVSVCSVCGFENGLNERIAKSVVLNKWCMEVIQDRMHEIAKEEMSKHPDLFNLPLRDKQKGRKKQFSIDGYKDIKEKEKRDNLIKEIKIAEADLEDKKQSIKELEEFCPIKSLAELEMVETEVEENINEMMNIINETDNIIYSIEMERQNPISDRINSMVDELIWFWNKNITRINELFTTIREKISNIKVFEVLRQIPEKLRNSSTLENRLQTVTERSKSMRSLAKENKIQEKEGI